MKGTDGVMKLVLGFAVLFAFCLVLLAQFDGLPNDTGMDHDPKH